MKPWSLRVPRHLFAPLICMRALWFLLLHWSSKRKETEEALEGVEGRRYKDCVGDWSVCFSM